MAPDPSRDLAQNEFPHLVEAAKAGDHAALTRLFSNGKARRELVAYALTRVTQAIRSTGFQPVDCEAAFDEIRADLEEPTDAFQDRLLAEAVAFADIHNFLAHAHAYELEAALREGDERVERRDHRIQSRNAAAANLALIRAARELTNSRLREPKKELLRRQAEHVSVRTQLLQEQLRQLRGTGSQPVPQADQSPDYDEVMSNPQAHGFDSFEDYVATLKDEDRAALIAQLARDDSGRGTWATPEAFYRNRFPTLFAERHQTADPCPLPTAPQSSGEKSEKCVKHVSPEPKLETKREASETERGASAPHPGPRSFRSDAQDEATNQTSNLRQMRSVTNILRELKEEPRKPRVR